MFLSQVRESYSLVWILRLWPTVYGILGDIAHAANKERTSSVDSREGHIGVVEKPKVVLC